MELKESGEMYLETILRLEEENGTVHAVDVARRMNFSKPTISETIKKMEGGGYVSVDGNNHIHLTSRGREIAEKTYERHQVISSIFEALGVNPATAAADACRVEHYISDETFEAMRRHYLAVRGKSERQ